VVFVFLFLIVAVLYLKEPCDCHWVPNDYKLRWLLADFGFSTAVHGATEFSTAQRGSRGYRAPELATCQFSRKSDIWSIGCVLYRLATKKDAFASDEAAVDYARGIKGQLPQITAECNHSLYRLKTFCPEKQKCTSVLEQINSIIGSCLVPNPLRRSTTMQLKVRFELMKAFLNKV
jgi:serine/threonine protein kinase